MAVGVPVLQRLIEVDGTRLDLEVEQQLERATVIDRLALPDTFVLVFRDPWRDVLARAGLEIGKPVRISTTSPIGDELKELMAGEVTSIEADYDNIGTRAIVRGYDLSHRLSAGRRTRTFQNVKLSDIAVQLANEAGLESEVDDSGATIEHVLQPNTSDLDFLQSLARRIGFDMRVEGSVLRFRRPTASSEAPGEGDYLSSDPTQLVWNSTLLEFRARMSGVAQVGEVKVRGWSVTDKEAVIGRAEAVAVGVDVSITPPELASLVGGETLVVVDRPVDTQDRADAIAKAIAEQVGGSAFEAWGVALGSPELKAGVAVSISNVDPALAGKWVITGSRHEFGAGAYRTHLEFSGRQDRSLHGILAEGHGNGRPGTVPGVVTAIVTNIDDPEDQGRVKVAYDWLADDAESFWCRLAMPGAGRDSGMVWIPQVGDEVVVSFVQGDMAHPIVLGGLWNGQDAAPLGDGPFDDGRVNRSGFVSRAGHRLVFFDADDEAGIALLSAHDRFRVSLNETKGQLHVYFDGKLVVDGSGDIQLKTDGSIKIEAGGSIDIRSGATTTLKGSTVALNPPG
jgi:uncharacterized protein involved in type VI secretion and phage assembly